jgi:hypothetical protein
MKNFLLLGLVAGLVGCGGGSKNTRPGGGGDDTPQWVSQGSGAFTVESGKKLQGVGVARASDPQARRQAADQKAQAQLQGGIDALAGALAKLSENTKDNAADDIKAIAARAAGAAQHVRDHFVTDGSESALDQIDLGAFKQALQSVDGDDALKREMANNTDRAYETLAKQ